MTPFSPNVKDQDERQAALDIRLTRCYDANMATSDKSAAAQSNFYPFSALFCDYTKFGIEPEATLSKDTEVDKNAFDEGVTLIYY